MNEQLLTVGKIVNTHGIQGEVKIWPHTDFPEERFRKGSVLTLIHPKDGRAVPLEVERGRPQKNVYIVKFKDLDTVEAALPYKEGWLKIPASRLDELPEGEYYHHEIIGCRVLDEAGVQLGTIAEILSPGANDVWVVNRPGKAQLLVPLIDEVVKHVDVSNKAVIIHLLEGME